MKIYVVVVEALRRKERGDERVEKLVWVPVNLFCKISFPVTHLMPYYAETGRSRPLIAWFTDNFISKTKPNSALALFGSLIFSRPSSTGLLGLYPTQNLQISLQNNGSDIQTCQMQLHQPLCLGVSIGADKGGVMEGGEIDSNIMAPIWQS